MVYLCHTCDSNSYPLRCLYILTLGLQGHNLKGYPVENAKKGNKTKKLAMNYGKNVKRRENRKKVGLKEDVKVNNTK